MKVFPLLLAATCAAAPVCAQAGTATFDDVSASTTFYNTSPGGPAGPMVTEAGIHFDGGVILDGSGFADEETTTPNLYATSDFYSLSDGSSLPGVISGVFDQAASAITLDVANGYFASTFTLSLFDAKHMLVGSTSIDLSDYESAGAVGSLSFNGATFNSFTVTSDQGAGNIDFAIDTVNVTSAAVPELATWAMMVVGFGAIGGGLRRRRTSVSYA